MQRPDLTVLAIPAFIGAMGAEYWWQRRNPAAPGSSRAGDYELNDTIASLTMGVGSLLAPFVAGPLVRRLAPGRTKGAPPCSRSARLPVWSPRSVTSCGDAGSAEGSCRRRGRSLRHPPR